MFDFLWFVVVCSVIKACAVLVIPSVPFHYWYKRESALIKLVNGKLVKEKF